MPGIVRIINLKIFKYSLTTNNKTMGIKYLTRLLKEHAPTSITHEQLYKLSGKIVAVDTSLFIYQCLMNIRRNGELMKNSKEKVISHIYGMFFKISNYLSLNITPIFIFDGKPPDAKSDVIKERKDKAETAKNKECNTKEEKEKQDKLSIRLTKEYIDDIKTLLNHMGVSYLHIDGEAEAIASELCRIKYVDYVITEDMDTLTFGSPNVIRNCIDKSIKRKDMITIINLDEVLKCMELSYEQFVELCIMCGCDYCSNIPRIGQVKAYQTIKEFGSIKKFLETNTKFKIPDDYVQKYTKSKELFMMYHDKLDPSKLPFMNSSLNIASLLQYLIGDCEISESKILGTIKKIQERYNSD